ncbi:hypothetical protein CCHL11_06418 [Colletotrichum chlorophyti]|uniref:Uncharacterized protein n=1 Tax=Colletotrichum chlorophyti TaxID=708187 RepID=A0A1Q8RQ30_9PEZI|nr:hypothetical protein CCHL11_06418 [Colletotrichum chlorophyti]
MENLSSQSRAAIEDALGAMRETFVKQIEIEVERKLKEENRTREFLVEELEILKSRSAEVDRH